MKFSQTHSIRRSAVLCALALCLMVSCEKPSIDQPDNPSPEVPEAQNAKMDFAYTSQQSSSKVATRSNPTGDSESEDFNVEDVVAISVNDFNSLTEDFRDYKFNGIDWEPAENGGLDEDSWWKWEGRAKADFRSYYPANATTTFTNFVTPLNQNTEAKIATADYMKLETVTKYYVLEEKITLQMERRMARVIIEVMKSSISYADANPADAIGFHEIAQLTIASPSGYTNDVANSAEVRVEPLKRFPTQSDNGKVYALVVPSDVNADENFLEFRYNSVDVIKKRTTKLEAGKSYTFQLTLLPTGEFVWEGEVIIENWIENEFNNQELD